MDQRLEHRLQAAGRQSVARRQGFGGDGRAARMDGDVHHGGDGEQAFVG